MTKSIEISCTHCGKLVCRSRGRINENRKFGWKVYCSQKCECSHKKRRVSFICENEFCKKTFERKPNDISPHNYCSQSCAAIANNRKCLKGRAKIKPKLKTCKECGKRFKKNTGNKYYCSRKCRNKAENYTPKELLSIIKNII